MFVNLLFRVGGTKSNPFLKGGGTLKYILPYFRGHKKIFIIFKTASGSLPGINYDWFLEEIEEFLPVNMHPTLREFIKSPAILKEISI